MGSLVGSTNLHLKHLLACDTDHQVGHHSTPEGTKGVKLSSEAGWLVAGNRREASGRASERGRTDGHAKATAVDSHVQGVQHFLYAYLVVDVGLAQHMVLRNNGQTTRRNVQSLPALGVASQGMGCAAKG